MGISLEELQESIDAEKQGYFDILHSKELRNIGKNFTEDEQVDVCMVVPSKVLMEELERREEKVNEIITNLINTVHDYNVDVNLVAKEEFIAKVRQIVRTQ